MLNKAREVADREGAEIIFTGEVLGQRPMSQHRNALDLIEKETALQGRLLRPLSAGHLPPTGAEREGRLDRGRLLSIKGRSRREQERLAGDLEIEEYPQPSGGCCFLADRNFGRRFHDLVREEDATGRKVGRDEIMLLKTGRHFRLSPSTKAIVGRDEAENAFLDRFRGGRWRLQAADHLGPLTLMQTADGGGADESSLPLAAAITARYCDGHDQPRIRVRATLFDAALQATVLAERVLETAPAAERDLSAWRL
jgi:hypothetical protein